MASIVVAPLVAAACNAVLGVRDVGYAGDAAAGHDAAETDAAPATDASVEAAGDAALPTDAAADAADAGWCAQQPPHVFCDDFDRSTAVQYGWLTGDPVSRLLADTHTFVSAPRSFLSTLAADAGTGQYARLTQVIQGSWHNAHIEVEIRIGDVDGGSWQDNDGIAAWYTAPNDDASDPGACTFVFAATASGAWVQAQGPNVQPSQTQDLSRFPLLGQWGRWAIDLSADAKGETMLSMSVDGQTALPSTAVPSCPLGGPFTFVAGLFNATGPAEVRYDNVTIDVK